MVLTEQVLHSLNIFVQNPCEETLYYLEHDLVILHDVIHEAQHQDSAIKTPDAELIAVFDVLNNCHFGLDDEIVGILDANVRNLIQAL